MSGPRRWRWTVYALLFGVPGCGSVTPLAEDPGPPDVVFADDGDPATAALPFVNDELLIQPYPGADEQALAAVYARAGAVLAGQLDEIDLVVLQVPSGELAESAAMIADSGLIEGVHKNYILEPEETPDDPLFPQQPHLPQVDLPDAWDITVGDGEVIIAIVDTGVDADHADLADQIREGWNVYDDNDDYHDAVGHGTFVAGVAAALSDNGEGIAGAAWSCPILVVRATDPAGRTTARHLAAGILWAVGHGAKVINVSFAPLWSNTVVRSAAQQAFSRGAFVVISAGNGGGVHRASGYTEALFVGAIDDVGRIASFSDRGSFVDLVAPGVEVHSTTLDSEYRTADGTSFAAPIVSGVAALAWSTNPDLRPGSIVETLTETATDLGSRGKDSTYGYGEVSAAQAVRQAARLSLTRDTTPPTLQVTRPATGAVLTGRYVVRAAATDRSGVADVVLSIDGVPFATDRRSPYRFVIDPATFSSGRHELSFVATDDTGNASGAQTRMVTFRPASGGDEAESVGGVVFRSPAPGTSVTNSVTIRAEVFAEAGLATVEWFVDGTSQAVSSVTEESSVVSYMWRAAGAAPGTHTIMVTVTDSAGDQFTGSITLNKP